MGLETLKPVVGADTFDLERTLLVIVTNVIDVGINLQRDVMLGSPDDVDTPLLPPPSNAPVDTEADTVVIRRLPRPPKLPRGC